MTANMAVSAEESRRQPAISDDVVEELLEIRKLQEFGVELTTNCNLACVYCHFAPLSRRGHNADAALEENILDFVRHMPIDFISLAGDSEITLYRGWEVVAQRMLALGANMRIISNFSKGAFSEAEVDVLSQYKEIVISIDTADAALLKKIRYRADLRTITYNIQQVRARCILMDRPIPALTMNVVTHNENILHADLNVAYAIANGFSTINFLRYVELHEVSGGVNDLWDNPKAQKVYPISTLSPKDAAAAVQVMQDAAARGQGRIQLSIQNDLLAELEFRLTEIVAEQEGEPVDQEPAPSLALPTEAETKDCLWPWRYFYVRSNGDVPPCCIVKDDIVDNASDKPLTEIINSDEMKSWRRSLLTGDLKPVCQNCTYVGNTTTESLAEKVQLYLARYGDI